MKKIPLTKGRFALVDDEDFDFLNQWKWMCSFAGYAVRNGGFKDGKQQTVYMARVILNTPKNMDSEHANLNRLDNRKDNLRNATESQNNWNKNKYNGDHHSRFKGVSWFRNKWIAYININSKRKHLGYHDNEIDAAMAYNEASIAHHGVYGRRNIIST